MHACVCAYACACVRACVCARVCVHAFVRVREYACVCARVYIKETETEKQRQRGEINQRCLKNVRPSLTQVQASSPTWVQACSPTGWKRCPTYGNQRAKSCCVPSQAYLGSGGGELHKHTSFSFLCMHINFDHQRTFFFPGTYLFQCS